MIIFSGKLIGILLKYLKNLKKPPHIEKLAIIYSNLDYRYFILPDGVSKKDFEKCCEIYNKSFEDDPRFYSLGDPIEIKCVFSDFLINSFSAHFEKN